MKQHPNKRLSAGREAPRDMEETGFTPILRRLLGAMQEIQAVVFVDEEGECVDYVARIEAFEAKVMGAQLHVFLKNSLHLLRTPLGEIRRFHIVTEDTEIWLERVSPEYTLVVAAAPSGSLDVGSLLEEVVGSLREEGGIHGGKDSPSAVRVLVRDSKGWGYAPFAFFEKGKYHELLAVLGRWFDEDEPDNVCFMVLLASGEESVLVHQKKQGRWLRLNRQGFAHLGLPKSACSGFDTKRKAE
ncbi:MAG: hypothetical protein N2515_04700 [Deltaproteobacteria bacterium]|nr:hypothetical protein [Deltaproteobacteria bacterium]